MTPIVITTLLSFYQGTGSIRPHGPSERTVQARVESCRRVGPLSAEGFGFWWICRVQVQTVGRGVVETVVDRSIVTHDDLGKTVELREACFHPPDEDCRYGKAVSAGWQFYAAGLRIFGRILIIVFLVLACFYVLMAVLGAPRYLVFYDWWQRKMGKRGDY